MAKSKPIRLKNKLQANKQVLAIAKDLKKKGYISKSAKLHGGRYISYGLLRRVDELQKLSRFSGTIQPYTSVKVSKAQAKLAKEEGYQVIQGNRVIAPKDHDFIKRIKSGMTAGVKAVPGGTMEEVTIPIDGTNISDFVNKLKNNQLDDLKRDGEIFAFKFHGHTSLRAFVNTKRMREYLEYYKQNEPMSALKIFRLRPEDEPKFIQSSKEYRRRNKRRVRSDARGNPMRVKTEELEGTQLKKVRKRRAQAAQDHRDRVKANPAKDAKYKERARARARASRERKRQGPKS